MVPVGRLQVGQLELGGHVLSLFCPLDLCSPCKISPGPLGANRVHFPPLGPFSGKDFETRAQGAEGTNNVSNTAWPKVAIQAESHPSSRWPPLRSRLRSAQLCPQNGVWKEDRGGGRLACCRCFEGDLVRRNQCNEWFAAFEKAPSGCRFHIYYFQPFQLDPWGFPGLPGGASLQAPLPFFPSPGTNVCFSHIFITAQAFRKDRGARTDMGTWCRLGECSTENRAWQAHFLLHAGSHHGKPGGWGMLGTFARPPGSPRFWEGKGLSHGFPAPEYQSASEKHQRGTKWFPSRTSDYKGPWLLGAFCWGWRLGQNVGAAQMPPLLAWVCLFTLEVREERGRNEVPRGAESPRFWNLLCDPSPSFFAWWMAFLKSQSFWFLTCQRGLIRPISWVVSFKWGWRSGT